jgi:hypothetical protein
LSLHQPRQRDATADDTCGSADSDHQSTHQPGSHPAADNTGTGHDRASGHLVTTKHSTRCVTII